MFVDRFPPSEVAARIAVSLGIGLLVGIEREWPNKDLGIRTFALTALLGTIAALFGPSMAIVSSVGVFLIVIFANARSLLVDRSLEATTSAALLVIFVLGALAGEGHLFTPVAAAILMTMLLAWKVELRRFAGGLQPAEIRSAVLLGLLGLVVYPILPDRFVDKWELLNPRQAWITVIIIAGIGFVNYVLLKVYGTRGVYVSGFLGGFVNSSAAAVELARPLGAGGTSSGVAVAALLLTIVAMFARNLLILALFSPKAVVTAAVPIVAMTLLALIFVRRERGGIENSPGEIHLESPVSLKRVLTFAGLFLLIQIVSTLSDRYQGWFLGNQRARRVGEQRKYFRGGGKHGGPRGNAGGAGRLRRRVGFGGECAGESSDHSPQCQKPVGVATIGDPYGCAKPRRSRLPCSRATLLVFRNMSHAVPAATHSNFRPRRLC
jgi:uncharacterized membrane protein (DUF4010 family)